MTQSVVLELMQRGMWLLLQLAAPTLAVSLVIGLMVSIFQAVTQINEMTMTFVPKLVAVFVTLVFFGPWMLNLTIDFVQNLLIHLPEFAK